MYYQDEPDIYCVHAIKVDLIYIYIYRICTIKVDMKYTVYVLSRLT